MKVIIVDEDTTVYEEEIEEHEIPALLDSGFVSAVLRLVEEGIEYAHVEYNKLIEQYEITWEIPQRKETKNE